MFLGFFKFFSEVDLKSKFLSPFLGKIIDRFVINKIKNDPNRYFVGFPRCFAGRLTELITIGDGFVLGWVK